MLWHGLRGDFPSTISLLVPQVEPFQRVALKSRDVNTLVTDATTGMEMEKGLGALLAMTETEALLGANLRFELRALLVEEEGRQPPKRHRTRTPDRKAAWSSASIYAWWLALRLAVMPVWNTLHARCDPPSPAESPQAS